VTNQRQKGSVRKIGGTESQGKQANNTLLLRGGRASCLDGSQASPVPLYDMNSMEMKALG
jgi:hypothetical protein